MVATTATVPVLVVVVPVVAVGVAAVGEGVVTRVTTNSPARDTADVIAIVRAITKFFGEDSKVAPVAPPNPPAITQAASNGVSSVKQGTELIVASKDPKVTPPPKEPPKPVSPEPK